MYLPGYYKTNYCKLRFREVVRMYGWRKALPRYWTTRFMRPGGGSWMPGLWSELECKREDLSEDFWRASKPHHQKFEQLGFVECGLKKSREFFEPTILESGGINYMDSSRSQLGQLLIHRVRKSNGEVINRIVIVFTSVFPDGTLSYTNHKQAFDLPPDYEVMRIDSMDARFIHQQFLLHLQQRKESPRSFSDVESLRRWFDERQVRVFEDRVRRGLFIPMTDEEVSRAKAKLQGSPSPPLTGRARLSVKTTLLKWAVLIGVLIGAFAIKSTHRQTSVPEDTIDYRGQTFKLARAYATYEDYKDDPDNLDTNELGRIEQAMTSATVPASFKNRSDFIQFMVFDLKFPGYGLGGIGEDAQTDDGSKIEVESVEIPQRDKDRYIVVRQTNGPQLKLVDDFVSDTSTNAICHVKLEHQILRYFNHENHLVREKHL